MRYMDSLGCPYNYYAYPAQGLLVNMIDPTNEGLGLFICCNFLYVYFRYATCKRLLSKGALLKCLCAPHFTQLIIDKAWMNHHTM